MAQPTLAELRAYAESGQTPLDSGVRAKLLSEHGVASKAAADYRKTKDAGMLKYRIAQLENSQQMLADNQRTAAALQETMGKNGRAAADAATRRANALTKASTDIATKRADFDSRTFNSAAAKYGASNRDATGAQDAAGELFNSMNLQGVKYNQANPNVASLADQYTVMVGAGSLADIAKDPQGIDKVIAQVGAKGTLESQLRTFLATAIQGEAETKLASEAIQKGTDRLRKLSGLAYANPDAPPPKEVQDEILSLNEKLSGNFLKLAGENLPEVQAQLQAAVAEDSEYQRLLGEADWYKSEYERLDPARRKSKEVSLGRIVAQPIFQEWAKSNGLNIGSAVVNADGTVTYAPGGDDFKALMRFQYQMQHPDRFGERLFFDRGGSTGTVVEVSYTDPAERERQLARLAYDNGNLVGIESDGKMRYLTKQQYEDANENNGAEPTGYRHAKVGDKLYVKDPIGNISEVNPDGTTKYIGDTLAGAEFGDAVIYKDGKPARYMTATDFNSPETLAVDGSLGVADPTESAELAKVSPFKRVPPDQAREIGTFTTIGTLDKMHANTIIKNGVGALSINGGQQIITPAMQPYVREIVHKDGTKLSDAGGVVRQAHAEKLAAQYGAGDSRVAEQRAVSDAYYGSAPEGGTTTAPLGTTAATTARAGSQIPEPSGLLQSALAGPNPLAQVDQLERSGLTAPGTSAQVADALAQAPAQAPAPAALATAAPSAAVTPAPATAPVASGAAAAAPAKPRITAGGYTYEVGIKDGQATYTVVSGPGVDKMNDKVIEPGDPRYAGFEANLKAEAAATAAPAPSAPTDPAAPTYLKTSDGYGFKVTGPPGARTYEIVTYTGDKPDNLVFSPNHPRHAQLEKNLKNATPIDYMTVNGYTYQAEVKPGQKEPTYAIVGGPGVEGMKDRFIEPSDKRYKQFTQQLAADKAAAATAPAAPAAPAPAAPAPAAAPTARPAPPKVEGRGEGVELEPRRGVLTEPTTRTRPTLASTIVGGLRSTLRTDAEGKEEPGLIEALKARREAKREEERATMRGEARAEAERQGERFQRAYDQSPRGRAEAAKSTDDAVSKAVAAGEMTASEASAARAKLGLKTPAAPAPAPAPAPAAAPAAPSTATPPPAPAQTAPAAPFATARVQYPTQAEIDVADAAAAAREATAQARRDYLMSVSTYVSPEEAAAGRTRATAPAAPATAPATNLGPGIIGSTGTGSTGVAVGPSPKVDVGGPPKVAPVAPVKIERSDATPTPRPASPDSPGRPAPLSVYRGTVSPPAPASTAAASPRLAPQFRPMRPANDAPAKEIQQYNADMRAWANSQ